MMYSGIDLHSNNSVVAIVDDADRVVAAEPPKFVRALDEGPANGCHRNSRPTCCDRNFRIRTRLDSS
jgi:hypothetical protein